MVSGQQVGELSDDCSGLGLKQSKNVGSHKTVELPVMVSNQQNESAEKLVCKGE
jgi:hypothetical protein